MYYNKFVHDDSTLWIRGTENIRLNQANSGLRVYTSLEDSFLWAFHRRVNVKERRVGSMSWIEYISALIGIPAGTITIVNFCKDYIRSKKDSKKDPSASLPAPDGSDDNLTK